HRGGARLGGRAATGLGVLDESRGPTLPHVVPVPIARARAAGTLSSRGARTAATGTELGGCLSGAGLAPRHGHQPNRRPAGSSGRTEPVSAVRPTKHSGSSVEFGVFWA